IPFLPRFFSKKNKFRQNYALIFIAIVSTILLLSFSDSPPLVRYLIVLFPFICLLNGAILSKIKQKNKVIAYSILLLLIFTNILAVFPLNLIKYTGLIQFSDKIGSFEDFNATYFADKAFKIRYHLVDYLYEITHDYDSASEIMVNYINENKKIGDTFISSDGGTGVLLMFYTDLPYLTKIDSDESANWIIFWNMEYPSLKTQEQQQRFADFIDSNFDLSKYQEITLNISNVRFTETPNPIHHKYRTDRNGEVILYHLKTKTP
ncbi:unnamed protein product, partial [marine sediment metagenome]